MVEELIDMTAQFRGLPMADLIGAPLRAACDAQLQLANATATFIKTVGFLPPTEDDYKNDKNAVGGVRTATFSFDRTGVDPTDPNQTVSEKVKMDVPLLAIVKVPSLSITTVDITFDMEVKSSFMSKESQDASGSFSADASVGWGPFSMKVHVEGAVASHKEQARASDSAARYHVEVKAEDNGMPEGLARVLDIMHSAIAPMVTERKKLPATALAA